MSTVRIDKIIVGPYGNFWPRLCGKIGSKYSFYFIVVVLSVNVVFVDLHLVSHLRDIVLKFILFTIDFAPCQFSVQILPKFVSLIMPVNTSVLITDDNHVADNWCSFFSITDTLKTACPNH